MDDFRSSWGRLIVNTVTSKHCSIRALESRRVRRDYTWVTRTLVMAHCAKPACTCLRTKRRDYSPPKTMHFWRLTGGTARSGHCSARVGSRDGIALMGHARGANMSEGWQQPELLDARLKDDGVETEDPEAIARYDGWVYAFGSHFGSKSGRLEPKKEDSSPAFVKPT